MCNVPLIIQKQINYNKNEISKYSIMLTFCYQNRSTIMLKSDNSVTNGKTDSDTVPISHIIWKRHAHLALFQTSL